MTVAVVFPERCSDSVVRWAFSVAGAMDASGFRSEDAAAAVARLFADQVVVEKSTIVERLARSAA